MNPLFRIDFSISDSLKIVRKSVLIYETIIQCDAIYTAFCLFALSALLERKGFLACILLGIGVAFKMQAFFFLPVFLVLALLDRRMRLWHFAAIPVVVWLSGLPAILTGAPWWLPFYMCAAQLKSAGNALFHNCPNLPCLFSNETANLLYPAFLLLGFAILFIGAAVVLHRGDLRNRTTMLFAAWCIIMVS